MKFFQAGLTVACALVVCANEIGLSQSPEQPPSDAVRVTVSMHPDGSRTVYKFDNAQHKAVATMLGIRLRGFPAWFAARTYHMLMMPGLARRLRLMADWTVGLLFGRASAELGQLGHPPTLEGEAQEQPAEARQPVP